MDLNSNYIFNYLNLNKIDFDRKEFFFQLKSSPHFPSFLSVVETLDFFNIGNEVFRCPFTDFDKLPHNFVAILQESNGRKIPQLIEKKGPEEVILLSESGTVINLDHLNQRWTGVVLLIEPDEERPKNNLFKKNNLSIVTGLIFLLSLLTGWYGNAGHILIILFSLSCIGLVLALTSEKNIVSEKNIFDSFCSSGGEDKCKILKDSNLPLARFYGDMAIAYFSFKFFGGIFLIPILNTSEILSVFFTLSYLSVPFIAISIFYQKWIKNLWCPICLTISALLLIELFILKYVDFNYALSSKSILFSLLVGGVIYSLWKIIEESILKNNMLEKNVIISNRIVRNYGLFKNSLLQSNQVSSSSSIFCVGDQHAKIQLTAVISPFCGPCDEAFKELESIFLKNSSDVQIKFLFKVNFDLNEESTNQFYESLLTIYVQQGERNFMKALKEWYSSKDLNHWNQKYSSLTFPKEQVHSIYEEQKKWCLNHGIAFTPGIFINNLQLPSIYPVQLLKFFIPDLIEDEEVGSQSQLSTPKYYTPTNLKTI